MVISDVRKSSLTTFKRPRGPLAALAFGKFRRIWMASVIFSLGNWGERLATGWWILSETESVFLAAATFAARQAPQLIFAPIGGAAADRFSRGKIMLLSGLYKLVVLSALALIALSGLEQVWLAFILLGLSGIGHSFELPAVQGMVTSSVPKTMRMNAVAVQSTGMRAIGALGALAAGYAIAMLGIPVTLIASGICFSGGGFLALYANRGLRVSVNRRSKSVLSDTLDGLKLMANMPVVRLILIAAVVVEIFGFAYGSVMPAVAERVLSVDEKGLGTLTMMAGLGSMCGTTFLMFLGNFGRKGLLLIGIAITYGIFLSTFSVFGSYAIALVLIMGVGASAAAFDAMQWTLLQLNVPEEMRGRAVGAWVFAIGFGWIGHIGLGAIGEQIGVQWALTVAGLVVILTGLVGLMSRSLRRL